MARPRGKIKTACQNKGCSFYLKQKNKNIIKKGKILRDIINTFVSIVINILLKQKELLFIIEN